MIELTVTLLNQYIFVRPSVRRGCFFDSSLRTRFCMASKGRSGTRATSSSRERQQSLQEALRIRQESPQTEPEAGEVEEANITILQQRRTPRRFLYDDFRSEIRTEIAELRDLVANAQLQDSQDDWTAFALTAIAEAHESPKSNARDKYDSSSSWFSRQPRRKSKELSLRESVL